MNKLGLHIIGGFSGPLGKPRVVKLLDPSVEYVAQVRQQIGPACLIIVRWYQGSQPLDQPVATAQQFVARYQSQMLAMRQVAGPTIVFEGYNEVPDQLASAYCAFEVERLRQMHALGLRSVAGNFSVGTPDVPVWATYRPMLEAMQSGDFVGLHEYWVDTADIDNRWHCARWTMVPQLKGRPIVVTECGRDVVEGRGQPGWRRSCDASTFLGDLRRYSELLEQFPNVLGATVFSTPGPANGWADFDPSPVWPQVVAAYIGAAWSDPSYQTQPQEEPMLNLGPDLSVPYYHSDRHGYKPEWIIIHDTEGPWSAALAWWHDATNPGKSSAHYLVKSNGDVVACVPEQYAAHHAGGGKWPGIPDGSIDGTSIINLVSIGIELEYPAAPASPPWPEAQLVSSTRIVADVSRRYGIRRDHILRHTDVSPTTRSDPRNLDWAMFLARVMEETDRVAEQEIRNAAWQALNIPYNPDAAFPKYAREHNLGNPVTREVDVNGYRLQGYSGGIVYARIGDWSNVRHMAW